MRVSPKEHLYELRAFWNDVKVKRSREHLKEKLAKPVWIYGAGGYGRPILRGIDKFDVPLMLEGAIPAALLALAIEGLFGLIERAVPRRG